MGWEYVYVYLYVVSCTFDYFFPFCFPFPLFFFPHVFLFRIPFFLSYLLFPFCFPFSLFLSRFWKNFLGACVVLLIHCISYPFVIARSCVSELWVFVICIYCTFKLFVHWLRVFRSALCAARILELDTLRLMVGDGWWGDKFLGTCFN